MADLRRNDTTPKEFVYNGFFNIDISCSQWALGGSRIEEVTFDRISGNTDFVFIKAILCASPQDNEADYHLVLFIKDITPPTQTPYVQQTNIPFAIGKKIKCVVIRYLLTETPPSLEDLNCALYWQIASNEDDLVIIPETHKGNILVGKQ